MSNVLYEENGSVGLVTFNRPEVGNAFSEEFFDEINEVFDSIATNDHIRSVILTGAGKLFCAGGDLNYFQEIIDDLDSDGLPHSFIQAPGNFAKRIREFPKPVIAAINGAAAGAGLGIALACDFRVMEERSSLVTSFINVGFAADTGVAYFLQRMVGTAKTTELLMFSPKVKGQEAKELGLATEVVADGELMEASINLANKLATKSELALYQQKQLINRHFYQDLDLNTQMEATFMNAASQGEDHKQLVKKFLSK